MKLSYRESQGNFLVELQVIPKDNILYLKVVSFDLICFGNDFILDVQSPTTDLFLQIC